jgi:hypothetical protein
LVGDPTAEERAWAVRFVDNRGIGYVEGDSLKELFDISELFKLNSPD